MGFNDFLGVECDYKEGLVAFLDILGFKNFVLNTSADELYAYYMYLSGFNQHAQHNGINMACFSDSIVITFDGPNIKQFLSACVLFMDQIHHEMGLFVRGGITYGKYYCANNISFGQGIVNAYLCEENAKNIKLAVDDLALAVIKEEFAWCLDNDDGKYSLNQFIFRYKPMLEIGEEKRILKDVDIKKVLKMEKSEIETFLIRYGGTTLYSKYEGLAKSFNNFCDYVKHYNIYIDKIDLA